MFQPWFLILQNEINWFVLYVYLSVCICCMFFSKCWVNRTQHYFFKSWFFFQPWFLILLNEITWYVLSVCLSVCICCRFFRKCWVNRTQHFGDKRDIFHEHYSQPFRNYGLINHKIWCNQTIWQQLQMRWNKVQQTQLI